MKFDGLDPYRFLATGEADSARQLHFTVELPLTEEHACWISCNEFPGHKTCGMNLAEAMMNGAKFFGEKVQPKLIRRV